MVNPNQKKNKRSNKKNAVARPISHQQEFSKQEGATGALLVHSLAICLGVLQFGFCMAELNAPQQVMSCTEFLGSGYDAEVPYDKTWLGKHGLEQCIPLDNTQIGIVTSIFSIGGLFGSYMASALSSKYGRKKTALYTSLLNVIGSWILFVSNNYSSLVIGRIILGFGSGIILVNNPLFISEISPVQLKGLMGSMSQVSINVGIFLTQFAAFFLSNPYKWRWILFIGFLLPVIDIALLLKLHESPKWLIMKHDITSAEVSLFALRKDNSGVKQEIKDIQQDLDASKLTTIFESLEANSNYTENSSGSPSLWSYATKKIYSKPRTAITMILMGQQFCGINSIIFYGVKIISSLSPNWSISINIGISILNLVMTLGTSMVVDEKGRKPLLLLSTSLLSISALLISVAITHGMIPLLIMSLFSYIASFAIGIGPIPFLIISELSNANDSAAAQSYGIVCNWVGTFIIGILFPVVHELIGGYVFTLFAVFAGCLALFIQKKVPETKGQLNYSEMWANY